MRSALGQTVNQGTFSLFQTLENISGSTSWHGQKTERYGGTVLLTWDLSLSLTSGKTKRPSLDWKLRSVPVQLHKLIVQTQGQRLRKQPRKEALTSSNCKDTASVCFPQQKNFLEKGCEHQTRATSVLQPTTVTFPVLYAWDLHWDALFLLNKSLHCCKKQCHTHLFVSLEIIEGQGNIRALNCGSFTPARASAHLHDEDPVLLLTVKC